MAVDEPSAVSYFVLTFATVFFVYDTHTDQVYPSPSIIVQAKDVLIELLTDDEGNKTQRTVNHYAIKVLKLKLTLMNHKKNILYLEIYFR